MGASFTFSGTQTIMYMWLNLNAKFVKKIVKLQWLGIKNASIIFVLQSVWGNGEARQSKEKTILSISRKRILRFASFAKRNLSLITEKVSTVLTSVRVFLLGKITTVGIKKKLGIVQYIGGFTAGTDMLKNATMYTAEAGVKNTNGLLSRVKNTKGKKEIFGNYVKVVTLFMTEKCTPYLTKL